MSNKQVAVFYGDDASPEVMQPTVDLLRSMNLGIDFIEPLVGKAAKEAFGTLFPDTAKAQIDAADATFFGSTSGDSTPVLFYLRWGKQTYANVRPCLYVPGFNSPMAHPPVSTSHCSRKPRRPVLRLGGRYSRSCRDESVFPPCQGKPQ